MVVPGVVAPIADSKTEEFILWLAGSVCWRAASNLDRTRFVKTSSHSGRRRDQ